MLFIGEVRVRDCCLCGTLELESAVYGGRKSKRVLFMWDVRVRECFLRGGVRVRECCLWGT